MTLLVQHPMRFSLVLALAASASASLVARQLPSCAIKCLSGHDVDLGGCTGTDNLCLCKSQVFVTKSTACIESACTGSDLETALSTARMICASVGVTLTSSIPASATDPPSSASASSASASSTPSTSAPAAATSTNAATHRSANALAGLAAVGLAALAL